ncbi:hypothetical protein ACRAWD_12305 [Caulobacter segnis]
MDATTVLSRDIAAQAIFPAVDPLDSTSRIMDPAGHRRRALHGGSPRPGSPAASTRP